MKSIAKNLLLIFLLTSLAYACKPKPACGTSREKAKKMKKLQSNPNFKM